MGLWLLSLVESLPFGIGTTADSFRSFGIAPNVIDLLKSMEKKKKKKKN